MDRKRTPRNYNGTGVTTLQLSDVLTPMIAQLQETQKDRPDLILASWSDLVGPRISMMTQAVSFIEGVLTVKVKNSTLYSLLSQHDKPRILMNLRERFPKTSIRNIMFRIG